MAPAPAVEHDHGNGPAGAPGRRREAQHGRSGQGDEKPPHRVILADPPGRGKAENRGRPGTATLGNVLFGFRASRAASSMAVTALAAALAFVACGGPEYRYVKSSSQATFFRVPHEWKIFDEDQILQNNDDSEEAKSSFKQASWSVGFDASPKPSVKNVLTAANHPTGLVQVRNLAPSERDTFSQSTLRSVLLGFDPLSEEAAQTGDVEILGTREVDQDGLHGSEFLVNLRTKEGGMIKWRQVALVDARVSRTHVLAITCTLDCYQKNDGVIEKIISSWKVRNR